jgi:hypothetical protein
VIALSAIPRDVKVFNAPLPGVSRTALAGLRRVIEDEWNRKLRAPRTSPAAARALAARARIRPGFVAPTGA